MGLPIRIGEERIAKFCRANQIVRLSLFGFVLRDDFDADSDVDVLVEFAPDALVTLLDMTRMEDELTEMLGRKVDLRTPQELSRYFRSQVLATAVVQYAG